MSTHAVLSPSGSATWLACPGSAAMQKGLPDESGPWAREGTAAHLLLAKSVAGRVPESFLGEVFVVEGERIRVDSDMVSAVNVVLDYVRERESFLGRASVESEIRVPIEHLTGEKGASGSVDLALVFREVGNGLPTVEIIDFKYGRVPVPAEDNSQLRLYALGFLYGRPHTNYNLRLTVIQPRFADPIRYEELHAVDLIKHFAPKTRAKAQRALSLYNSVDFVPLVESDLTPGQKQCKWCKAKPLCPGLMGEVQRAVGQDFKDAEDFCRASVEVMVEKLPTEELGKLHTVLPLVEMWHKAVRLRIQTELRRGEKIPGLKLVEGRRAVRRWSDEKAAAELLEKLPFEKEEIYSVISPTQAEKLAAKSFPTGWKKLGEFIVQGPRGLTVVEEGDKRPALDSESLNDDFTGSEDI